MDTSRRWFVYLIWSVSDERKYVGKTFDVMGRWKSHIGASLRGSKTLLARTLAKSARGGTMQFAITELQSFDSEKLAFECEKFWIEFFSLNRHRNPKGFGLNLTDGGEGASGCKRSIETRTKISKSLQGHSVSQSTREKLRKSQVGSIRTFTHTHVQNLRANVHNKRMYPGIVLSIAADYQTGMTRTELSRKYGFCYKSICRVLS